MMSKKRKIKRIWFLRLWSQWFGKKSKEYKYEALRPIIHIDLRLFGVSLVGLTVHWKGIPARSSYVELTLLSNHFAFGREDDFVAGAKPVRVRKLRKKQ